MFAALTLAVVAVFMPMVGHMDEENEERKSCLTFNLINTLK